VGAVGTAGPLGGCRGSLRALGSDVVLTENKALTSENKALTRWIRRHHAVPAPHPHRPCTSVPFPAALTGPEWTTWDNTTASITCRRSPPSTLQQLIVKWASARRTNLASRPRSDGGRRSRHGADRTPQAAAAAQDASSSRSAFHRRGRTLELGGQVADGRQVDAEQLCAPAPTAPRSAGPGPGHAESPPKQAIELTFDRESGMLPTATRRAAGHRGDRSSSPRGQPWCVGQQMGSNPPP
jgi:hypothetical protein